MEMANLVLLAYWMYEDFSEERGVFARNKEWTFPSILHGSVERRYDYHNQLFAKLNGKPIEYEVLAEFWHTDTPVGKLRLETVPFGFIVRKVISDRIKKEPEEVFVVFRGTLNSQEWAANAMYRKSEAVRGVARAGFIHKGFNSVFETSYVERVKSYRGLYTRLKGKLMGVAPPSEARRQSIRETLESVVFNSDVVGPDAKIYVTGHSLGGALAMLAGRVIANAGRFAKSAGRSTSENPYHESLVICTFAAPRVGDEIFASVFDGIEVVRYVNTEDIVPTVPPATSRLLGADMSLTPEGLRSYKEAGFSAIADTFKVRAGSVQHGKESLLASPFTHVGEARAFTLSQDSISFNHNLQETYREGIVRYHDHRRNP